VGRQTEARVKSKQAFHGQKQELNQLQKGTRRKRESAKQICVSSETHCAEKKEQKHAHCPPINQKRVADQRRRRGSEKEGHKGRIAGESQTAIINQHQQQMHTHRCCKVMETYATQTIDKKIKRKGKGHKKI